LQEKKAPTEVAQGSVKFKNSSRGVTWNARATKKRVGSKENGWDFDKPWASKVEKVSSQRDKKRVEGGNNPERIKTRGHTEAPGRLNQRKQKMQKGSS